VEDYKLRTLVNDVVGLLEELDVDRAAVVGHDWGAALAGRWSGSCPTG
jgi:pimeloyl-ACP methyl ester carboxylesterase